MKQKSNRKKKASCDRNWSDLPVDPLNEVRERAVSSWRDFLAFRAVCKSWRRAFVDGDYDLQQQRAILLLKNVHFSFDPCPKAMRFMILPETTNKTVCEVRFSDLLSEGTVALTNTVIRQPKMRKLDLDLSGFCCSNSSGWLLLLIKSDRFWRESRFLIRNPLRDETHELKLPKINWKNSKREDRSVKLSAFSTNNPTSLDCVIFALWVYGGRDQYFTITTYSRKDRRWTICELPSCGPDGETWKFLDVAYLDGKFYCAIDMNNISSVVLGTFDVALGKWVVMDTSPRHYGRAISSKINLVESDGEILLTLYKCRYVEFIWKIYRFNLPQKHWTRVESLGNRILVLHKNREWGYSSFSTPAVGVARRYENKIIVIHRAIFYFRERDGHWSFEGHDL